MSETYLFACDEKTVPNIKKKNGNYNFVPDVIYDFDNLAKEWNEYRKNNIFQKKADALCMEKMLYTVLKFVWSSLFVTKN